MHVKRKRRSLGFGNQRRPKTRTEAQAILAHDAEAYDTQAQRCVDRNAGYFLSLAEEAREGPTAPQDKSDALCLIIADDPNSPGNYSHCFGSVQKLLDAWQMALPRLGITLDFDGFLAELNSRRKPDQFLWMHMDVRVPGQVIPRLVLVKNADIAAVCYAPLGQETHIGH